MKSLKRPTDLGPAGRALWGQIEADFDVSAVIPTLMELCRCADRLSEIRQAYRDEGGAAGPKSDKYISSETRVQNQFRQFSRALGMHDTNKGATRG